MSCPKQTGGHTSHGSWNTALSLSFLLITGKSTEHQALLQKHGRWRTKPESISRPRTKEKTLRTCILWQSLTASFSTQSSIAMLTLLLSTKQIVIGLTLVLLSAATSMRKADLDRCTTQCCSALSKERITSEVSGRQYQGKCLVVIHPAASMSSGQRGRGTSS